ncbi:UDP-N-acetylglucosamine 1-carboxyvinyltransferase [Acidimicrobiia bacterium]|jgi:UDP-N-acetylglucosamine 1-carboxyvinyltransferase|nr:UDP-N-acetylglucosamine 1-carboxyvinyltransferase [Acidimicrobiia bacterium]MDA7572608.1 UDP-N-acetylglucosamine 1-carboxyvinyltransferase [bacterium]MDA7721173.1 UDP-N-acetylglucosamine 1-carboxyvinyltransferase [Acidimicrobiaceae bacterium]MDA8719363.1 UDP-N-acetylglucosamine 1-carboxyvinyltransferase [Candidatus Actinomarina sp.]MDA8812719.1 UDP-N-acetylglucosamine 1-carboxyvinyltransferase [Candidatus Actinomarina sp.]|tara:strand:+ start:12253 stop:13509 length:1257 start_codon:yes stop_codon:yes gene_type:complete
MIVEKHIVIEGNHQLNGDIKIKGAKNAVLKQMVLPLLASGKYEISNVPNITDVTYMREVLSYLGIMSSFEESTLIIDSPEDIGIETPYELVQKMRASIVILGPLLARKGKAMIAFPGGDQLGPRPVQMHLDALEKMGANFHLEHGVLIGETDGLKGVEINLPYASVGATENTLLAAVLAEGKTVIENAAREPEIVDIVKMLKNMGAQISGEGTSEITIEGVPSLNPTNHDVVGDRVVAGTFIAALASTGGSGSIIGINENTLPMEIKKFQEMGLNININDNSLTVESTNNYNAIEFSTLPFPGVATDLQPIFGAALLKAEGTSIITENVYDQRFQWIPEVQRMGSNIQTGWQHAMIRGVKNLSGAPVNSTDIRTGASLIIAALQAEGESQITGVDHIDRGYEDIVSTLDSIGAVIEYN